MNQIIQESDNVLYIWNGSRWAVISEAIDLPIGAKFILANGDRISLTQGDRVVLKAEVRDPIDLEWCELDATVDIVYMAHAQLVTAPRE